MTLFKEGVPRWLAITVVSVLFVIIFGQIVSCSIRESKNRDQISQLQNELAKKDETIEVQKNVYKKLAVQADDLLKIIDSKDAEIKLLKDEIEKKDEKILTTSNLVIKWKKAYEGLANATQTDNDPVPNSDVKRKRVEFDKDFGFVRASGWTLTDPPEAWVSVKHQRPLRVTLAVTQSETGQWATYATSSEEDIAVDIELTAVNPHILREKWYEKIGLWTGLAGGSGGLLEVGATYEFNRVEVGPFAAFSIGPEGPDWYVGMGITWYPFKK